MKQWLDDSALIYIHMYICALYMCAHPLKYFSMALCITVQSLAGLCFAILNKYLIIKEDLAVLQVGGHYYYLLHELCRFSVKLVVRESMWVESKYFHSAD